ncbi:MAG: alcohol dehydrogenase family protein [Pseudomonadota bacterium]
MSTMRAMVLTGHGDMDKLVWHTDWPKPEAGPGEVLIRVGACGLNNTDVNTRSGWYSKAVTEATTGSAYDSVAAEDPSWGGRPLAFPRIQGADVAGRVEAVGDGVDPGLVGKRVMVEVWLRDPAAPDDMNRTGYYGSEIDGGFAEYTKAPAANVHPIECDLTDAELATFATSYVTAENMLNRAAVKAGDSVLITGASGGVGSALIQLARRRGARAIAMAGEDKWDQLSTFSPDAILPRSPDDLAAALQEATGRREVSVVADVVGGSLWPQLIGVIERGGRYTCSGAIAGPIVAFDLRTFYLRDLVFTGATVVPKGTFADLVGYIARGEIKPILAETYPLEKLHDAQRAFIAKKHVGNIVVVP